MKYIKTISLMAMVFMSCQTLAQYNNEKASIDKGFAIRTTEAVFGGVKGNEIMVNGVYYSMKLDKRFFNYYFDGKSYGYLEPRELNVGEAYHFSFVVDDNTSEIVKVVYIASHEPPG